MPDAVQGIEVGQVATLTKTVTDEDIRKFAEATGDSNPLHLDSTYAARTRFKQTIAHGMLSASVISAVLGTVLAPHAVVIYLSQNLRFRAPVKPGDTLEVKATVTSVDIERSRVALDTVVTNQDATEVLIGDALVMVEAPNEA
jgi:3-hydroxybutyryl-CoA dehydratase